MQDRCGLLDWFSCWLSIRSLSGWDGRGNLNISAALQDQARSALVWKTDRCNCIMISQHNHQSQPRDAEHPLGLSQNLNPQHWRIWVLGRVGLWAFGTSQQGPAKEKDLTELLGRSKDPFVSFGSCCWVCKGREHRELGSIRGEEIEETLSPHKAGTGVGWGIVGPAQPH